VPFFEENLQRKRPFPQTDFVEGYPRFPLPVCGENNTFKGFSLTGVNRNVILCSFSRVTLHTGALTTPICRAEKSADYSKHHKRLTRFQNLQPVILNILREHLSLRQRSIAFGLHGLALLTPSRKSMPLVWLLRQLLEKKSCLSILSGEE
jgi:hypothetical protein